MQVHRLNFSVKYTSHMWFLNLNEIKIQFFGHILSAYILQVFSSHVGLYGTEQISLIAIFAESSIGQYLQLISQKLLEARISVYFVNEETEAQKVFLKLYSWA